MTRWETFVLKCRIFNLRAWAYAHRARLSAAAVVLCFGLLAVQGHFQGADNAATASRLTATTQAQVAACKRLNIEIAQTNIAGYSNFLVLQATVALQKAQTASRLIGPFVALLVHAEHAQAWIALTDCKVAVEKFGPKYRLASPVPFSKQTPPKSALTLPRS